MSHTLWQSSPGRRSFLRVAACGLLAVCWTDLTNLTPFSLPARGDRGIKSSSEMTAEEWEQLPVISRTYFINRWFQDETTTAVEDECKRKWFDLPSKNRSKIIEHHEDIFNMIFCQAFDRRKDEVIGQLLTHDVANDLRDACEHALGDDIKVEIVGSLTRGNSC